MLVLQECTIEMAVGSLDLKTVNLRYGVLILRQKKDMTLFQITYEELYYKNASNTEQGLQMLIRLKRKIMSEMMTTYFPSILLMLITFATTIFKDEYFEASLSVNLTTMLVMTTIFISKMEGLPPTSDIKMIDIWLILCQLVPFAEVVLITAMEYYRQDENVDVEGNEMETDENLGILTVIPCTEDLETHEPPSPEALKTSQTKRNFKGTVKLLHMIGETILIRK